MNFNERFAEYWLANDFLAVFVLSQDAFVSYISPTILVASVFLVNGFSKMKVGKCSSRAIGYLSPLTFGVYLIHENKIINKRFISDKFSAFTTYPIWKMCLAIVGSVFIIYILASVLDFLRSLLFKLLKIKKRVMGIEESLSKRFIKNRGTEKEGNKMD